MSYTLEFQPAGIRLVLDEPIILMDAVRQSGIDIRADCGGKGICGKCLVQIIKPEGKHQYTKTEISRLSVDQRAENLHLACETVVSQDAKIFIPNESINSGQIFQIEGSTFDIPSDPAVIQRKVQLIAPDQKTPSSVSARIRSLPGMAAKLLDLEAEKLMIALLENNAWTCNLIIRGETITHVSKSPYVPLLGLAVDVGSTKIACFLIDLNSGKTLAAKGSSNPQIIFGEDIMTRLEYAQSKPQNESRLHEVLMQSINRIANELTAQIGRNCSDIADFCLVGNTAMHHFFLNIPSRTLAYSPFSPFLSESQYSQADKIGLTAMPGASVFTPPVIAGFVGSDHLAFLYSVGFHSNENVRLAVDIGTNTEIALQAGGRIVSVSTASGPAFEGAHIRFGMRAGPGAIEHVYIQDTGSVEVGVIEGGKTIGICGSGILDAVSEMRKAGILDQNNRLNKNSPFIKMDADGKPFFPLSSGKRPVTLSQKDIDQVLLAKGAIRAGIDVLMHAMKIEIDEIDEVLIAGAFGSYMLPRHAIGIGMLPQIDLSRIHAVGNAAGAGARMMLISKSGRSEAEKLASRIEYLELASYPDFPLFFAHGIQA